MRTRPGRPCRESGSHPPTTSQAARREERWPALAIPSDSTSARPPTTLAALAGGSRPSRRTADTMRFSAINLLARRRPSVSAASEFTSQRPDSSTTTPPISGRAIWVPALLLASVGCVAPEPGGPLPFEDAPAFAPSGVSPPPQRWWTVFNDAALDQRVELALADNLSLTEAWERLREARAIVRFERAALFPQLDGTVSAVRIEPSDSSGESEYALGLEASYEVDLWGRISSSVDAERLRASATEADYEAGAISISAEVAIVWYQLATARLRRALIESQLGTNLTVLDVLEKRFAVGQSGSADVLRQRQLVEGSREQLVVADAEIRLLIHQLAVLEGRPPQQRVELEGTGLPIVPAMPATGLPSELLQRRPDVRAAYLQLAAADQDIASAVADQYPRVDLGAAILTAATRPGDLFNAWVGSFAGQLTAPLIDGGRRRAEVERTEAVRRQRLAFYGQTVLVAFREVEDALTRETEQVGRIDSLEKQLVLADRTVRQLRTQYLNGATDFIDALIALREQQQLERTLLEANFDRVAFRIALYRAIAGSFATPAQEADAAREADRDAASSGGVAHG